MNSKFAGWSQAEAVKRTTGSKHPDDPRFWPMVERGELVVFGRRHNQSKHEWMPSATYKSLLKQDLDTSSATGPDVKHPAFFDILIYPVLHAPNAVYFLNDMPLKDAFWQFVLRDPEVEFLASEAIEASPYLKRVYLEGDCAQNVYVWPVVFEPGSLAGGASKNDEWYDSTENPPEVQRAADIVCLRYGALLTLLRDEKLDAFGDPVRANRTSQIPSSIWSRRSYYFDARRGDLLKTNDPEPSDWFHIRLKRWRAVTLKKPQPLQSFHVKPPTSDAALPGTMGHASAESGRQLSAVRASIAQAINALWANDIPMGVAVKTRDEKIRKWQADNGFAVASTRTIDRYLKNKN